jgi:hypothetical protein
MFTSYMITSFVSGTPEKGLPYCDGSESVTTVTGGVGGVNGGGPSCLPQLPAATSINKQNMFMLILSLL